MLKCITFDGDTSTLNTLMGYFEKLDKALADVHQALSKEQTERPIFVREGAARSFASAGKEILFPRRVRRLCKGTPYQWQAPAHASQLEAVRGVSGQESFLPGTSLLHRIPLPH